MGEVLVARGAGTSMDVAASAKDPGFASCSGSSSRETMVVVEVVKVNGSVGEWREVGGVEERVQRVRSSRSGNPRGRCNMTADERSLGSVLSMASS